MDAKRILLIEDDLTISELLAYNLRQAGYEVLREADGSAGLKTALSCDVDLVIVDLMLPGLDGMTLSREFASAKPDVPLIVLTARTEREIRLEGFQSGADDFVTKPFDLDELLARVAARLKRTTPREEVTRGAGRIEGLTLDRDTHELRTSKAQVFLKPKEFDLLELLISAPGHLFRREEIMHRVWQQGYTSSSRTLDVHVRHVREKLERIDAPAAIENVRGVGYRIVATERP